MAEQVPKWRFELWKVFRSTQVRWTLKDNQGRTIATSNAFVDQVNAQRAITFIKNNAATFEVHLVPGFG
jgi:uncharacterized protein YegP (UPF0339 family)